MLKIRLSKSGSKNKPFYRVVAVDEKKKVYGKNVDIMGYFNPSTNESKINMEKYNKWKSFGAQTSQAVKKLLKK